MISSGPRRGTVGFAVVRLVVGHHLLEQELVTGSKTVRFSVVTFRST